MANQIDPLDPEFLKDAEMAVYAFREKLLDDALGKGHLARRLRAMLADPFLRPLVELSENGATSYEGALRLNGAGYLRVRGMTVRSGVLRGEVLQYVSVTEDAEETLGGWSELREARDPEEPDAFDHLVSAVRRYLVMDHGSGFVVTRDVAEVAIDLADQRVLGGIVKLHDGSPQFVLGGDQEGIEDADWLDAEDYWSGQYGEGPRGASILELAGHLSSASGKGLAA